MKDIRKSYKAFAEKEHGNAMMIALVVTAILGAGFIGYKSGQEDIFEQFVAVLSNQEADQIAVQEPAEEAGEDNPVIAKVDGDAIRRQDVINLVNAMPPQMRQIPLPKLYPMALEQAISNKIVDKKASMAGLENDKEVQKQLFQAQQQIVRAKFLENAITSKVGDARVKTEYEEYLKNFPDVEEVKAAHILLEDEKTAKEVIAKIGKGEEFAALAKEYSQDDTADKGGVLGYFAKNEVVPAFAEAAFAAKVGTYSKKPVKSEFGYHVIRVDEKRKRPPAEFEQIKSYLAQDLQRKAFDDIMNEWKSAVNIERFDVNGNPIPSSEEPASGEEQAQTTPESGNETEPAAGAEEGAAQEEATE